MTWPLVSSKNKPVAFSVDIHAADSPTAAAWTPPVNLGITASREAPVHVNTRETKRCDTKCRVAVQGGSRVPVGDRGNQV